MNNNSFGEWVREKRVEKELSQEQLASDIRKLYDVRLSGPYVSMIENGDRTNLTSKLKAALIDYLSPFPTPELRIESALDDDPELLAFWTTLREREDLKLLFKQVKDFSSSDVKRIMRVIKAIEYEEDKEG
ncbi:MAG: helix-turn-helix domain-containing protein [Candidatus Desulforudaceae bacterium]